jgi:hypothetical protein
MPGLDRLSDRVSGGAWPRDWESAKPANGAFGREIDLYEE